MVMKRLERQGKITPICEKYFKDENIFDPNYIIKGISDKDLQEIKEIPKKETISDIFSGIVFGDMAFIYLHHLGINTIQNIKDRYKTTDELKQFLESKRIDKTTQEAIIANVAIYYNEAEYSEIIEKNYEHSIYMLGCSINTINLLQRNGLYSIEKVINEYDVETGWKGLDRIRDCSQEAYEEILEKLEKKGFLKDGKPLPEFLISYPSNPEIEELELSVRTYNALRRCGIDTVGNLLDIYENKDSLANIRKLGKVGIKEIEEVLEYRGFTKNGIPIKIKPNDKEKSKIIEGIKEKRSQFLERISLDDSNEVGITNSNNKGKFNQEAEREDNSRED